VVRSIDANMASKMSEQNRRINELDNLCIYVQGQLPFDGIDTSIEVPADGQWHRVEFMGNANEVDELSIRVIPKALSDNHVSLARIPSCGWADKPLSPKEIEAINELLVNHPEIKFWWLKNNVLYLEEGGNDR